MIILGKSNELNKPVASSITVVSAYPKDKY